MKKLVIDSELCCGEVTYNAVDTSFEDYISSIIPTKIRRSNHRNLVIRYGSNQPYDNNIVDKNIPKGFDFLKELTGFDFDSVTINEYLQGQIIDWHTDKGKNDIYVISLLSDNNIQFKNGDRSIQCHLPRFSMFRMSGELRSEWQHYVKSDNRRISIVLRKS